MDIKVAITKFEQTDWFSVNLQLKNDQGEVHLSHICKLDEPGDANDEISKAVKFAHSLLDGNYESNAPAQSGTTDNEPLAIDGFQPVQVKTVQSNLDLPDRAEFEISAKRRELSFLSSQLNLDAQPSDENLDQALKIVKLQATSTLLPIYTDKINYLLRLLGEKPKNFCEFSESVVNLFNELLDRSESLPSDVLVSDSESLAEKLEFNLPSGQLSETPHQYFSVLHKEELQSSISNIGDESSEWSQTA